MLSQAHSSPGSYQYPVTPSLAGYLRNLEQALHTKSNDVVSCVHVVALHLFRPRNYMQEEGDYNKWNDPLECFMALHNLTPYGNFKPAKDVTQLFSKLEYLIRGTTLYEGHQQAQNKGMDYYQYGLFWLINKYYMLIDFFRAVTEIGLVTLKAGIISPFNAVVHYQQWTSSLAILTISPPVTRVSKDRLDITYGKTTLNVPSWRQGLQQLFLSLEEELKELLYGDTCGLNLPTSLDDNWAEDKYGYSWMDGPLKNRTNEWGLLEKILSDPALHLASMSFGNTLLWNKVAVTLFMQRCNQFIWRLGFLGLATNGQPARISEFVEHKICNSHRPRTIFHHDKHIWMVIRRGKTENLVQRADFRPVKCHPSFTSLYKQYILLLRPLEAIFASVLWGPDSAQQYKQFLFMDLEKPITSDRYLKFFPQMTKQIFGQHIGALDYRHLTVEISRIYLGRDFLVDLEDEDDILATQRGHKASTARWKYAPEENHLPSMTSDTLLRFGEASEAWWQLTGFREGFPPQLPQHIRQQYELNTPSIPSGSSEVSGQNLGHALQLLEANLVTRIEKLRTDISSDVHHLLAEFAALQHLGDGSLQNRTAFHASVNLDHPETSPHAHSPSPIHLGSMPPYPRPITPSPQLSYADLPMEVEPSPSATLSPTSSIAVPSSLASLSRGIRSQHQDTTQQLPTFVLNHSLESDVSAYVQKCLEQFLKPLMPSPTFRSNPQMVSVAFALSGTGSFMAHLPTGMGKSFIFQIPAFVQPDKTNIVIVPNAFLLRDHVQKAQKAGLRAIHWTAAKDFPFPSEANLIFMALETAVSKTFER